MQTSYWSKVLEQRLSRRRALAATGATAAAAAFLAACGGGGGSNSGATADKSGLITAPVDTTKQAKRGGQVKWFVGNEPAHFDVQIDQAPMNMHKNLVYGHLTNEVPGLGKPPAYETSAPEMAESWEWSPDHLQLTMHIRQGVKWHNKAPVNGRPLDVNDITFSWDRFMAKGTDRRFLGNVVNPDAPVLSLTAVDSKTIVFKLKEPIVFLLSALTPVQTGRPSIIPKETDTTFDIRSDMIGTGPFILDKYTQAVGFSYKRNPDYYDQSFPLVDSLDVPIILEYAQALAQLKAGNIYTYSTGSSTVKGEDVLAMKRDTPDLKMYSVTTGVTPPALANSANVFGYQPTEANKPFKDERVRQAISMSWDRDAWVEAFYNVSAFQAQGLPVTTQWATSIFPGGSSWWLDPKGKDFGPNAKYFQFDLTTAKQLLSAAGYANGFDTTSSYIAGTQLGADYQRRVGVMDAFTAAAGIRSKANLVDYTTYYIPLLRDANGKFDGWAYRAGGGSAFDATVVLSSRYHSKYGAQAFAGFDVAGKGDASGDPAIDAMIGKARIEPDTEKRRQLVYDIQRTLAKSMWDISFPGCADGFLLSWPVIGNFQAYQGDRRTFAYNWWIDDTQAPLKKA